MLYLSLRDRQASLSLINPVLLVTPFSGGGRYVVYYPILARARNIVRVEHKL